MAEVLLQSFCCWGQRKWTLPSNNAYNIMVMINMKCWGIQYRWKSESCTRVREASDKAMSKQPNLVFAWKRLYQMKLLTCAKYLTTSLDVNCFSEWRIKVVINFFVTLCLNSGVGNCFWLGATLRRLCWAEGLTFVSEQKQVLIYSLSSPQ